MDEISPTTCKVFGSKEKVQEFRDIISSKGVCIEETWMKITSVHSGIVLDKNEKDETGYSFTFEFTPPLAAAFASLKFKNPDLTFTFY